jgi:hypothetical protein
MFSVLAIGPKIRGFKPGRGWSIFKDDIIRSATSFGGEVKPSVPCRKILIIIIIIIILNVSGYVENSVRNKKLNWDWLQRLCLLHLLLCRNILVAVYLRLMSVIFNVVPSSWLLNPFSTTYPTPLWDQRGFEGQWYYKLIHHDCEVRTCCAVSCFLVDNTPSYDGSCVGHRETELDKVTSCRKIQRL